MSRLPSPTGKQLIAALKRLGFEEIRVRGSHHYLRHPDGRSTVVPIHAGETIGHGLVSKILRDCEIDRDELAADLSTLSEYSSTGSPFTTPRPPPNRSRGKPFPARRRAIAAEPQEAVQF